MSKQSKGTKNNAVQTLKVINLLVAGFYMQSVLTVAHHASFPVAEPTGKTVENPAVTLLIVGVLLAAFNFSKERRLSLLNAITLTVFVTASIFWGSGLRANFFF